LFVGDCCVLLMLCVHLFGLACVVVGAGVGPVVKLR